MLLSFVTGLFSYIMRQCGYVMLITAMGGTAGLGDYKVAVYSSMMLMVFLSMGGQTVAAFYFRRYVKSQDLSSLVSITVWLSRIITFYGVPIAAGIFFLGYIHHFGFSLEEFSSLDAHPAVLSIIGAIVILLFKITCLSINAYNYTKLTAISSNLIMFFTACIVYLAHQTIPPLLSFVCFITLTFMVTLFFALIFIKQSGWTPKALSSHQHPDTDTWKKIAFSGFFSSLNTQLNLCFILLFAEYYSSLFNESFVGFIAIAISLTNGAATLTEPQFNKFKNTVIDLSITKNEQAAKKIQKRMRYYFLSFFSYASILVIFSPSILELFFKGPTTYEIQVFRVAATLMPFTLFLQKTGQFVPLLLSSKDILKQAYTNSMLSVVLISICGYMFQAIGLFLGAFISTAIISIFFIRKMHQELQYDIFYIHKKLSKLT